MKDRGRDRKNPVSTGNIPERGREVYSLAWGFQSMKPTNLLLDEEQSASSTLLKECQSLLHGTTVPSPHTQRVMAK